MRSRTYILPVLSFCLLFASSLQAQMTTKIKEYQLPESSKNELDKKYSKYEVNSMVKKVSDQKKTTYEIELQKKNKLVYLVYDITGSRLSTSRSKIFSVDGMESEMKIPHGSNGGHNHMH